MKETILTWAERQTADFDELPLNSIDSTILSWMAYVQWPAWLTAVSGREGTAFRDAVFDGDFTDMFSRMYGPERSRKLYLMLTRSRRFCDVRICLFRQIDDEVRQMQYASLTYLLPNGDIYVAFRGTDNSLVGWKEDFNMAYECPIPSQSEAQAYLEQAAALTDGRIYVGGHSKGGNLAVYAASSAYPCTAGRIEHVWSHDGPGFPAPFYQSPGYRRIRERITKTVPQSSLFGLIMNGNEVLTIVRSDSISFLQHYPFNWRTDGTDFVRVDRLSPDALFFSRVCSSILEKLTVAQRSLFIDTVYEMIRESGFRTADGVMRMLPLAVARISRKARECEPEVKNNLEKVNSVIRQAVRESLIPR